MADNLKVASKKSQNASKIAMLDSLGTDKSQFLTADLFNNIEVVAGAFIDRVKTNIEQADLIVTGKISDIRVEVDADAKEFRIIGNPWLLYQDRGVNGSEIKKYNTPHAYTDKRPPADVFIDYIKTKNISLRNNENYTGEPSPFASSNENENEINSMAYAMATKIYKEGFKPQPIFKKEIPQLIQDIKQLIPAFMSKQIIQDINAKASDALFPTRDYKK